VSINFDRPKLWIVAGPNGSGKSSLYTNSDIEDFAGSVWIINPDVLSARILHRAARTLVGTIALVPGAGGSGVDIRQFGCHAALDW
jgi:predicted ABC-type ATPase